MSTLGMWLSIVAIGIVTFGYRLSFIFLFERLRVPAWLRRALRFVPIAALTAIITPELMIRGGAFNGVLFNSRMLAGVVAAAVAYRTRSVLLTIAVGMLVLWAFETLFALVGTPAARR